MMINKITFEIVGLGLMSYGIFQSIKILKNKKNNSNLDIQQEIKILTSKMKKKQKVDVSLYKIAQLSWLNRNTNNNFHEKIKTTPKREHPDKSKENKLELGEQIQKNIDEIYNIGNKIILDFYEKIILPRFPLFIKNQTLELMTKILHFLATECNISSVVNSEENTDSSISYTILKKITLAEHSINTAIVGLKLLNNEYPYLYDIMPDKYLTLFLGHDLGKTIDAENYSTHDHPIFSSIIISEMIPDSIPWKKEVVETIKNHHIKISENSGDTEQDDLRLLQSADKKAREMEIQSITEENKKTDKKNINDINTITEKRDNIVEQQEKENKEILQDNIPVGITPDDILKKILPIINSTITSAELANSDLPIPDNTPQGNFVAISQPDGNVYIRPDVIYKAFLLLVQNNEKLLKDNAFLIVKEKNDALKDIVRWFIKNKYIPHGHVKIGFFGRYYNLSFGDEVKEGTFMFTPILIQKFGVLPGELEKKRKENTRLANIKIRKK